MGSVQNIMIDFHPDWFSFNNLIKSENLREKHLLYCRFFPQVERLRYSQGFFFFGGGMGAAMGISYNTTTAVK